MPTDLRPMSEFDPDRLGTLVYDELNDRLIPWEPRWAEEYRAEGLDSAGRSGLILTGWKEADEST